MKRFISITLLAVLFLSCGGKSGSRPDGAETSVQKNLTESDPSMVNVYYFHGKQRCKTCMAIEDVTEKTVADHYKEHPNVRYVEVDFDDSRNEALVEKYEIAFSSLLIARGEDFTDLTEQAFANAVNSPEVLTGLIQEEVNKRVN